VLDAQIQVAGLEIVDKLGENNRVGTGFPFGFIYLPTGSHGATISFFSCYKLSAISRENIGTGYSGNIPINPPAAQSTSMTPAEDPDRTLKFSAPETPPATPSGRGSL